MELKSNKIKCEDNSGYIIPYLFNDTTLFTISCFNKAKMFYDKLDLYYSPVSKKQEAYICVLLNNSGVSYSKEVISGTSYTIRISVLIPKELSFTAKMLSMNEEEMVTKNVIMDALSFWKELAYIVLVGNKNTQAARDE